MELWQRLGELHPKLVQFPVVLLLVGLIFDLAGLLGRKGEWARRAHAAALAVSGLGTVGLLFAFICGIYAEIWAGRAGISQHPIELHELAANVASWGFVILMAWRIFLAGQPGEEETRRRRRQMATYVTLGLIWYVLLGITGYLGGKLVFEYGAGVSGVQGSGALTLADLNTLAARQTDENLRYSEWMHHVFGWMTVGLAASLLAQALWPGQERRFRWIVPTFLLLGGVFLFVMADRDLYAWNDMRQWRDREVELHKTLAIVMASIGMWGLWGKRETRNAKRETQNTKHEPGGKVSGAKEDVRGSNSRVVAVMALIGGAMLFTHVHTVAPYANVAAGVYIAHVVMGLVALSIGLTRLLQDWVDGAGWRRGLRLAFAGLMAVEAVLLVTYNEGLPWFIGYGRYNRWGPLEDRNVTIAPFGDFRAAMYVNQKDGKVFVGLRDRFTDDAVVMTLDEPPHLLLARGNEETALVLTRSLAEGETVAAGLGGAAQLTGSNFQGQADFLKSAPLVSARLEMRVKGQRLVGYFDPWVTAAVTAVPPNEVARFECPMHPGIQSAQAGQCGLCGMELQPIRPARAAELLHDAGFQLHTAVEAAADDPKEGLRVRLVFRVEDKARADVPLAVVHEQPMHVIIVSEDLAYFDHVHPMQVAGAMGPAMPYGLTYRFPRAGRYVVFVDVTPQGDRAQVFRVVLEAGDAGGSGVHVLDDGKLPVKALAVDGDAGRFVREIAAGRTPQDSAALDKTMAPAGGRDVLVQLVPQPRTIYAGLHTELVFRLMDAAGRPLTDLKPYLGAMGHCVAVSEDTGLYLHSHPEQFFAVRPEERGGPEVAFHAAFPKAGRYRIWGQFKRAGEYPSDGDRLIIADCTVEVKEPWLPAGVIRFLLNE